MAIRQLLERWNLGRKEARWSRAFERLRTVDALRDLLAFAAAHGRSFPIATPAIRDALAVLDWRNAAETLDRALLDQIVSAFDAYVLAAPDVCTAADWTTWLRMSRFCRTGGLPVLEMPFARALLVAKDRGILDELPRAEADDLLHVYRDAFTTMLDRDAGVDAASCLTELAALVQVIEPTDASLRVLARHFSRTRPRAISLMSDDEAWRAPLRGIGSPNGMAVTVYVEGASTVRIVYAGATPDRNLNGQLLSSIFAAALACDNDDSFVGPSGGVLRVGASSSAGKEDRWTAFGVSVGLGGASDAPGMMGMEPADAIQLATELLHRIRDASGLVSVCQWAYADAAALEAKIRTALTDPEANPRIRSEEHGGTRGVIDVIPLFRRTSAGAVDPVRLDLPYAVLDPARMIDLVATARHAYLAQLVSNARRRESVARKAFEDENAAMRRWQALSEQQRHALCLSRPFVVVSQRYNFHDGVVENIEPKQIPRRKYEDEDRPALRESAQEATKKFGELAAILERTNRPGGVADRLTFRYLVDALLRREHALLANAKYQADYRAWMDRTSDAAWMTIDQHARRLGIPSALLAADNVLFNATVIDGGRTVRIEPHVMIDLHDFEIIADRALGLVYVFPGGRAQSLAEATPRGDPPSLHAQFHSWAERRFGSPDRRMDPDGRVRASVMGNPRTAAILLLRRGQRLLMKGEIDAALNVLDTARAFDLAPIYFWIGIAHQFRFLRQHRQFPTGLGNKAATGNRNETELSYAAATLVQSLAHRETRAMMTAMPMRAAIDGQARRALDQLVAKDHAYVAALVRQESDPATIEQQSLALSAAEIDHLSAAEQAVAALDLLRLAERMRDVARALPSGGQQVGDLRREMFRIVEEARRLPILEVPAYDQIRELASLPGGD